MSPSERVVPMVETRGVGKVLKTKVGRELMLNVALTMITQEGAAPPHVARSPNPPGKSKQQEECLKVVYTGHKKLSTQPHFFRKKVGLGEPPAHLLRRMCRSENFQKNGAIPRLFGAYF